MKKMWLLRRLKEISLEESVICDYYTKEIRSVAEFGAVIWHSGLTKSQSNLLEKIQKIALKIILGDKFVNYADACAYLKLPLFSQRRVILSTNFALKLY